MIYLTGDTHGAFDINKINPKDHEMMRKLGKGDYLIICGDFGCLWDGDASDRFWLNWLESLPWTTLFVDGNHENFDVIQSYPEVTWHGGKAHRIRSNIYHLERGEIFEIDSRSFFTFGGAASHDAEHRTEFVNWWKNELPRTFEVKRAHEVLAKAGWKVDYVISHDVPLAHPMSGKYWTDMARYGEGYENIHNVLEEIRGRLDYRIWFTGHYHDDFVWYDRGKPIVTLFNRVVDLDDLHLEEFRKL